MSHLAELLHDVVHDGGGLGVDDPLGAARQPVDLPLAVPPSSDRRDLLDTRRVLTASELKKKYVIFYFRNWLLLNSYSYSHFRVSIQMISIKIFSKSKKK